jgi:hypothetical protein
VLQDEPLEHAHGVVGLAPRVALAGLVPQTLKPGTEGFPVDHLLDAHQGVTESDQPLMRSSRSKNPGWGIALFLIGHELAPVYWAAARRANFSRCPRELENASRSTR